MAESENERHVNAGSEAGRGARPRPRAAGAHDLSLRDIGRSLVEGRWVVAGVTLVALALAIGYYLVAPPVYRASALVQIEDRPEGARRLEDLTALHEPRTTAASEIEIMRSRLVLGAAVEQLGLDLDVRPRWFPAVGQGIARRRAASAPASPLFRLARFAWGGERIAVKRLEVPEVLLGRSLRLTALERGRFRLADTKGNALVEGAVGTPAATAGEPRIEILVGELVARPGTEFRVEKLRRGEIVDRILRNLSVVERGTSTGVVAIELEGEEPVRVAAIVSAICDAYLKQNLEKSQAETEKTLEFLEGQLPSLKANLETAEAALNAYRERRGTVDLPLEAKAAVDRTAELDRTISELEMTYSRLGRHYSGRYPEMAALRRQIEAARSERGSIDTRNRTIPGTQLASSRLVRNVNVATELYVMLLDKAQELRVVRSGRTGDVRVVDRPSIPYEPVRPKAPPVLALGLLLGLAGGVAAALARRVLDESADDPGDIEAGTGLPVFVTVPHSAREATLLRSAGIGARVPLAVAAPDDVATESLRTLRTALGFVIKARGNVVAVSSPSAGVGKTFVCANLANLVAAAGQRVLLVDADLRQGVLHRFFSVEQGPGLSDVLAGRTAIDGAIATTGTQGLDLLPRGEVPSSPAELLASPRLAEVLAAAAKRYDVVVVDTPPVLTVTDALLVARCASVNLLVLRARQHPVPEIALALERLARSGIAVHGGILNDARPGGTYSRIYARLANGG